MFTDLIPYVSSTKSLSFIYGWIHMISNGIQGISFLGILKKTLRKLRSVNAKAEVIMFKNSTFMKV